MQVAEGVFQLKMAMPRNPQAPARSLRFTLIYVVDTPVGWTVIDAGMNTDEGFAAFKEGLSEIGIAPQDITSMVVTHAHPDHVGMASRLKEFTGARLAMHRLDASGGHHHGHGMAQTPEVLRWWTRYYGVPAQQLADGFLPQPMTHSQEAASPWRYPAPTVDLLLEGGEEIVPGCGLWAIWTPGHSPGHLCIHDRNRRILFSGDHVLPTITAHVSLHPGDDGNPLKSFLQVQRELKELDVDMVYPAHQHSFSGLSRRVDEILEHHQHRMDEILDQVKGGPKTSWQITSGITWNVAPWPKLSPWTRRMALMETMAHLQHMVEEGGVTRQETDSSVLYGYP